MDYRQRWELKEYRFEQRFHWRTTLLHAVLLLLMLAYLGMFGWLQIAHGAEWGEKAEANRLRKIPILPNRGVVYDRHHEVLASTRPSLNLVLRREGLQDADGQLHRLEALLGIPYAELRERLDKMKGRPSFEPMTIRLDASWTSWPASRRGGSGSPRWRSRRGRAATTPPARRWRTCSATWAR
jgi:penicillin-binding protein 2